MAVFSRPAARNSFLVFFAALSCGPLCLQNSGSGPTYISGTWSDACPCSIPCSCWKMNRSSAQLCVNFHVFRIRSGLYDGTDLAGSTFVLVNLPRVPGERPVPDTLIIGMADAKTASAIENVVRHSFAFSPSNVSRTAMQYHETERTQELLIRGLLNYKISFEVERPLSDEVSENLYPWLSNTRQGIVKSVIYSPAAGKTVRYSDTNAISGVFRIPTRRR